MSAASQLTLFAEDFPAKTSPLRERARELKASVPVYGQSLPDSLASFDPDTQSWRTSQHCLIEGLSVFSETWPRSGMMQNGIAYRLPPLVPLTDATESGSWPTPATKGYGHAAEGMVLNLINKIKDGTISKEEAEQMLGLPALENHRTWKKIWPTPTVHGNNNRKGISKKAGDGLATPVKMWPTPNARVTGGGEYKDPEKIIKRWESGRQKNLCEAVRLWPTPSSRDGKGGYIGGRVRNGKTSFDTLDVAVQATDNQDKTGGQLNPTWVEWLMGFPLGWTDCGSSATRSSRKSLK